MSKRNHPLRVGEVVFDTNKMFFGIITNFEKGKATLEMNKDFKHNFDCLKENLENFDCEIPEDERFATDTIEHEVADKYAYIFGKYYWDAFQEEMEV